MRPTQRRVLSAVTLLLLTALGGRSAGAQTTVRVSVASDGTEGNDVSLGSALSADGRFVAFDSAATDLVAGDTNGVSDVFVHDRQTGTTERVSVASDGAQGNGSSGLVTFAFPPALSADGRFVAFVSFATNLVASDTNGATDVFVHDRQTATTERVSVASDGTEGNAASAGATLSADGRFVAFHSAATNLVAGDTNGTNDVFVHDRQTGITERVSVASDGTQGNNASSYPAFSADGRFVAFDSDATDLVAGDTNGTTDVFVHDRQTATTERVSVNGFSAGPALSADGRFVAFHSTGSNLVAGDTNGATDVFVHDRQTGTTERVSGASDGTQGNDASAGPALSADGRLVAFHSSATNLVAGDANRAYDVFVHDRAVSTTTTSTTQPATTSTTSTTTTTSTSTTWPPTTTSSAPSTTSLPTTTISTTTVTMAPSTTVTTASTTTVTTAPPTTVTTASTTTVTTAPPTTVTTASTTTVTTASTTTVTTAPTTTVTTASTTTVVLPSTTTTTLRCELAQLTEDSLAGVECAIGMVRATLTEPPQPECRCKRCSLEPTLDRLAAFVRRADTVTSARKCKGSLKTARRAAKSLHAKVASLIRSRCLAPVDRVAILDAEIIDLTGRTKALSKSGFCAGE